MLCYSLHFFYSKTCLSGHSSITVTRPQRSLFKVPNDFLLIGIGHYLSITITCPLRITVTYFGPNHSYSTCGLRAVIAIYCHEAYLARAGRDMASLFTQLAWPLSVQWCNSWLLSWSLIRTSKLGRYCANTCHEYILTFMACFRHQSCFGRRRLEGRQLPVCTCLVILVNGIMFGSI